MSGRLLIHSHTVTNSMLRWR